jgi:hypothetical protein
MWGAALSFLGGLSPMVWVVAFVAALAGSNAYTALKVHEYDEAKHAAVLLKQEVRIVEKEKEVLVLDKKTLAAEVARTEKRVRRELEQEKEREKAIADSPTALSTTCLTDSELRLWNDENTSYLLYNDRGELVTVKELQADLSSRKGRNTSEPVAEQGGN